MPNTDYAKPIVWADSASEDCNDERDGSNWFSRMSISRMKHEIGCCLKTDLQRVVPTSGWTTFSDLFRCRLTKWSTIVSVLAQRAPLKRLQQQEQSTTGWLTPICDLTQWDSSFQFVFFLLGSSRKTKTECCVFYDDGWQRVEEPPTLWYQMFWTRPSMRKHEQHLWW